MAADVDIVLNTAADLSRVSAWVPVPVVGAGDGTVDVDVDGEVRRYAVTLRAEERTVEWRPVDHDGVSGQLTVSQGGAGSSQVELAVADVDDVGDLLDRALRGLAAEVDQNFNVS